MNKVLCGACCMTLFLATITISAGCGTSKLIKSAKHKNCNGGNFFLTSIINKSDVDYTFSTTGHRGSVCIEAINAKKNKTLDYKIVSVSKNKKGTSFDLMPQLANAKSKLFLQRTILLTNENCLTLFQVGPLLPAAEPLPDVDIPVNLNKNYAVNLTITPDYSVEIVVEPLQQ